MLFWKTHFSLDTKSFGQNDGARKADSLVIWTTSWKEVLACKRLAYNSLLLAAKTEVDAFHLWGRPSLLYVLCLVDLCKEKKPKSGIYQQLLKYFRLQIKYFNEI